MAVITEATRATPEAVRPDKSTTEGNRRHRHLLPITTSGGTSKATLFPKS